MEDIILEFWECSLKSDFSEFDWDNAFDTYYPYLERNCIEHGQGTFEQYLDYMDSIYGLDSMENDIPDWCGSYENNPHWYFSKYDAMIGLLKTQYESLRENYRTNIHGDNAKLLEKIDNRGDSEPELIQLFDECIHAEHVNGNILEDIDIEDLREQAEQNWKDEQEQFITNIRDFL